MGKGSEQTRLATGSAALDGLPSRTERPLAEFHLLRHQVVLLAMKHGRAPLPVTSIVWRGLQRRGAVSGPYDLGNIARRLSFLGDGRLLLDELKLRRSTGAPDVEKSKAKRDCDHRGEPSINRG